MTQTANNYGEVLFELGIKKDTVEESKRIFSLTEQLHRTLESPIISKNEKYSIIEKVFPKEIENFLKVVCDHEKMSYIDEIIEALKQEIPQIEADLEEVYGKSVL